jgi:hypothetical protein
MEYLFRSLGRWPYPSTRDRRSKWTFKATFDQTMRELRKEVSLLKGDAILIGVVADPNQVRRDGMLRAGAYVSHPGVEISFNAKVAGKAARLVYATDVCEDWTHNVRSIALGLEALRAVDRYGITRRGEQYAGFAALTSGGPDPVRGEQLVKAAGNVRDALMKHHPDHGGNPRDFADVQAYREAQERRAS